MMEQPEAGKEDREEYNLRGITGDIKEEEGKAIMNVIAKEKIERYLALTQSALLKAKIAAPDRSFSREIADNFYKMAKTYYEDALHFFSKGDWINAFAAVNYAHGWLDAGARLGVFDVGGDDQLFTLLK